MIIDCNNLNYSIFLGRFEPDEYPLFSYFEYIDNEVKTNMAKMVTCNPQ